MVVAVYFKMATALSAEFTPNLWVTRYQHVTRFYDISYCSVTCHFADKIYVTRLLSVISKNVVSKRVTSILLTRTVCNRVVTRLYIDHNVHKVRAVGFIMSLDKAKASPTNKRKGQRKIKPPWHATVGWKCGRSKVIFSSSSWLRYQRVVFAIQFRLCWNNIKGIKKSPSPLTLVLKKIQISFGISPLHRIKYFLVYLRVLPPPPHLHHH